MATNGCYGLWRPCWEKVSFSTRGVKGSLGNSSDQSCQPSRAKINNYQLQVLLLPPVHPTDACRNKEYFCVCSGTTISLKVEHLVLACLLLQVFPSLTDPSLSKSLGISHLVHHPEDRSIHCTFSSVSPSNSTS